MPGLGCANFFPPHPDDGGRSSGQRVQKQEVGRAQNSIGREQPKGATSFGVVPCNTHPLHDARAGPAAWRFPVGFYLELELESWHGGEAAAITALRAAASRQADARPPRRRQSCLPH